MEAIELTDSLTGAPTRRKAITMRPCGRDPNRDSAASAVDCGCRLLLTVSAAALLFTWYPTAAVPADDRSNKLSSKQQSSKDASSMATDLASGFALSGDAQFLHSMSALHSDLSWRLGPKAARRNYTCDLMLSVEPSAREPVHIVFVLEAEWLPAAFALILSLLETNGGACADHGAFRFHIVVPEEAKQQIERRLGQRDPSRPLLSNAVAMHAFTNRDVLPYFSMAERLVKKHSAGELKRIQRPANFARFALPDVLPPSVAFAFYLDTDFIAAHGPIGRHIDAPLKRAYHSAAANLVAAANTAALSDGPAISNGPAVSDGTTHGPLDAPPASVSINASLGLDEELGQLDLRAAVALVPSECTPDEFAKGFVGWRTWVGLEELRGWLKGWADAHVRFGGLCFNAGAMLMNMGEWRRQRLTYKLQALIQGLRRSYPNNLESTRGTQRPLQLLLGGRFTRLPAALNVQGECSGAQNQDLPMFPCSLYCCSRRPDPTPSIRLRPLPHDGEPGGEDQPAAEGHAARSAPG